MKLQYSLLIAYSTSSSFILSLYLRSFHILLYIIPGCDNLPSISIDNFRIKPGEYYIYQSTLNVPFVNEVFILVIDTFAYD